jgi:biotin operon repressor
MSCAALGFRAHSGWAATVALRGPASSPHVFARRRIELVEPGVPKQPYHTAEGLPFPSAEKMVTQSVAVATRLAREAVQALVAELRQRGCEHITCGVLQASGRSLPGLEQILSSHALIHTAEGELFRNAVASACEDQGLPVSRVKERELLADAGKQLGMSAEEVQRQVADMGRPLGAPWGQDQKYAALIAWMALAKAQH